MRLAYFVSHPIQYQAPLLRRLAAHPDVELTVFFLSDFSTRAYRDPGFGVSFDWDVPLLEGYDHEFLGRSADGATHTFFTPIVTGVGRVLRRHAWDAALFHGYAHHALVHGITAAVSARVPLFFRSESSLTCTSRGPVKDRWIRWLVAHASALLWIGRANEEYYRAYGAGDRQLFFVPYAVDNDFFRDRAAAAVPRLRALRTELDLADGRPVVLFAGKLIARKNPRLLVEAFADAVAAPTPDRRPYLVYVGDGEERTAVETRARELGLGDDVRFTGFRNQTALPDYFALCDLFVIPSQREPFGLIVNEVMNAAKPVISTDEVGASRDLVVDGVNGYVVPAGDRGALAAAVRKALADPAALRRMGDASARLVADWNYERCVEGIVAALHAARRSVAPAPVYA